MKQTSTIAELATASSRNRPVNSPVTSSPNAIASAANEAFAMLAIRILLLVNVLKPTMAGKVK